MEYYHKHFWDKKHCNKEHWDKEQKDTNSNVNIINVNVDCCDHKKNKHKEECCDHKKDEKKENVRPSAFRATQATNQTVAANTLVKVLYQNENFDLANEYNPTTSTFIPATGGVYNLLATVIFSPTTPGVPFSVLVAFRINNVVVGSDSEFQTVGNIITATDIRQLNAGDVVEVVASATVPGQFLADVGLGQTRFAASRVPSPTN